MISHQRSRRRSRRRSWWRSLRRSKACCVCRGIIIVVSTVRHRGRTERILLLHFIEIRLSFHVRKELALIWYCSPHQYCELRQAPHEALVVVCAVVVSGLVKAFEAPAIQLTRERFVFSLHEICGYDLLYKEVLVVHLPCPAVWHPRDDMRERRR